MNLCLWYVIALAGLANTHCSLVARQIRFAPASRPPDGRNSGVRYLCIQQRSDCFPTMEYTLSVICQAYKLFRILPATPCLRSIFRLRKTRSILIYGRAVVAQRFFMFSARYVIQNASKSGDLIRMADSRIIECHNRSHNASAG